MGVHAPTSTRGSRCCTTGTAAIIRGESAEAQALGLRLKTKHRGNHCRNAVYSERLGQEQCLSDRRKQRCPVPRLPNNPDRVFSTSQSEDDVAAAIAN